MSSVVVQSCTQGFVITADSIATKVPRGENGNTLPWIKGVTRKLFKLNEDVVAAAVGEWTSYLPVLNAASRSQLPVPKLIPELLDACVQKAGDSCIFILYRIDGKVLLDTCTVGHVRRAEPGAVAYPNPLLTKMFDRVYESPEGWAIRKTGILGIASLIEGFNAMAAVLSTDLSAPFDTVLFLNQGLVVVKGGITQLPVTEYW